MSTVPQPLFFSLRMVSSLPAPVLVSPQLTNESGGFPNGRGTSVLTTDTVTYTWLAVTGASSYHIQVSTSPLFGSTLHDVSGIVGVTYLETLSLADNTEYYWRVQATGLAGTSPWSYTGFFFVLDSYATIVPANGAVVHAPFSGPPDFQYTFNLDWTMQAGEVENHSTYITLVGGDIVPGSSLGHDGNAFPPLGFGVDETSAQAAANGNPPYSFVFYRSSGSLTTPVGADPFAAHVTFATAPGLTTVFTVVNP